MPCLMTAVEKCEPMGSLTGRLYGGFAGPVPSCHAGCHISVSEMPCFEMPFRSAAKDPYSGVFGVKTLSKLPCQGVPEAS
jgi:hypothetical protein